MSLKAPRGRPPIRVERKEDPRYRFLMVKMGGIRILYDVYTLAEVQRRLELWPQSSQRAEISFTDEHGHFRQYVQYTGKGKKMTAYVSGLRDIHADPTTRNQTVPSYRRVPTDALIPHTKNDHDHQHYTAADVPVTKPRAPRRDEKPIRNLPSFGMFEN